MIDISFDRASMEGSRRAGVFSAFLALVLGACYRRRVLQARGQVPLHSDWASDAVSDRECEYAWDQASRRVRPSASAAAAAALLLLPWPRPQSSLRGRSDRGRSEVQGPDVLNLGLTCIRGLQDAPILLVTFSVFLCCFRA